MCLPHFFSQDFTMRLALLRVGPTWALPSRYAATAPARAFTISLPRSAEGDTGSIRSGGSRQADTWSRREKAAEDMYIREREKQILKLLKEKIAEQEAKLVGVLHSCSISESTTWLMLC